MWNWEKSLKNLSEIWPKSNTEKSQKKEKLKKMCASVWVCVNMYWRRDWKRKWNFCICSAENCKVCVYSCAFPNGKMPERFKLETNYEQHLKILQIVTSPHPPLPLWKNTNIQFYSYERCYLCIGNITNKKFILMFLKLCSTIIPTHFACIWTKTKNVFVLYE